MTAFLLLGLSGAGKLALPELAWVLASEAEIVGSQYCPVTCICVCFSVQLAMGSSIRPELVAFYRGPVSTPGIHVTVISVYTGTHNIQP